MKRCDCRHDEEASKLLLGLNFYGNNFMLPQGGKAIVGHEYLDLLRQHMPKLTWDKRTKEHAFDYHSELHQHRVYFPSVMSISKRCDLAEKHGMGIAIWEIGQGLEQFYELL